MTPRVLVGGIGNVFLGDDGFGVAVVERLRARPLPSGVRLVDFGLRGIDLAFAMEDHEVVILIDAMARGGPPGTVYVLEPDVPAGDVAPELHAMTPDRVLRWIGGAAAGRRLRIVGCEPATFGPEGLGQVGLSPPVEAAVDEAARRVVDLVREALDRERAHA
jgi:hydrogenase maturation protease